MPTSEHQEVIDQLFCEAVELDTEARRKFLDRECADFPPEVRKEIESLIGADRPDSSRTQPFVGAAKMNLAEMLPSALPVDEMIGKKIGRFTVKKKIAEGGFGTVYLGIRDDHIQQKVAIKILRSDHGENESVLRRFEIERQLLSDLDHPFIARLIDGGSIADGRPYFAMEYVDGQPITDYCIAKTLDIDHRLKLFQNVCQAVAHAHQFSVVHRDIKPSNILVTSDGTPKLLDFGIAKLTDRRTVRRTVAITETGQLPMTPEYASPEQLLAKPIGQASDVYSLGIVLYELLTGARPYKIDSTAQHEFVQAVCSEEPTKPSTAISKIKDTTTVAETKRLRKKLVGDLDNIVLMALRKEPDRRYQSVNVFSEDIQRYFDGHPVVARKDSAAYRAKKFVHRNRAAVVTSFAIVVAMIAAIVGITLGWKSAVRTTAELRQHLYASEMISAWNNWQHGNVSQVNTLLHQQVPEDNEQDLRGFEWSLLASLYDENQTANLSTTFASQGLQIKAVTHYSPDKLALLLDDASILLIEPRTGDRTTLPIKLEAPGEYRYAMLRFDDRSHFVAVTWVLENQSIVDVINIEEGTGHRTSFESHVICLTFSLDGELCACGDHEGKIRLWNTRTQELLWESKYQTGFQCSGLEFSPDGMSLANVSKHCPDLVIWQVHVSEPEYRAIPINETILSVAWSPDNQHIAVGGRNLKILKLDGDSYDVDTLPTDAAELVSCVAFSPNAKRIAYGTLSNRVEVRDLDDFDSVFQRTHVEMVRKVFFTRDGQGLLSISDNEVKHWEIDRTEEQSSFYGTGCAWNDTGGLQLLDGSIAIADGHDVAIWDLKTNRRSRPMTHQSSSGRGITGLAYSPARNILASSSEKSAEIKIWNGATLELEKTLVCPQEENAATTLSFSNNGSKLLAGGNTWSAMWDVMTEKLVWRDVILAPSEWCNASGFTNDGRFLVTAGGVWENSGFVRIWDNSSSMEKPIREFQLSSMATTLDISQANLLAVGDQANTVSVFDLNQLSLMHPLKGHSSAIASVRFTPDGKRLVSGGWDRLIKIWDVVNATEYGAMREQFDVTNLRFITGPQGRLGLYIATKNNGEINHIRWLAHPKGEFASP